jgi:hypothetical protein
MARADDNGMDPSTAESYAVFDGGYSQPAISNSHVDPNLPAWRQAHPNGLSERELQALSSESWAARLPLSRRTESLVAEAPTHANAAKAQGLRRTHSKGPSERELQALSSDSSALQLRASSRTASLVAEAPTFANACEEQDVRRTHPNGLSERELQALSSESWTWRLRIAPGTARLAAAAPPNVAQSSAAPFGVGAVSLVRADAGGGPRCRPARLRRG